MVHIVSADNFNNFIESGLVLVDFFTEWCGPCKMLAPVLDMLAEEMPSVTFGKINIEDHPAPAEQYGVSSIPTLILFKDGKEVDRTVGLQSKEALIQMINQHV